MLLHALEKRANLHHAWLDAEYALSKLWWKNKRGDYFDLECEIREEEQRRDLFSSPDDPQV
jgi:hypothetical protein